MSVRGAFTLIELLVVIAVVALLMGVLLPALSASRQSAEMLKAGAAVRSLGQAFSLYADDQGGWVLPAHLTPLQASRGVVDEFGNALFPPVSQRWPYRLGAYFDHGWAGTTHVGERARFLAERRALLDEPGGLFQWAYEVSVFPSFGVNRRFVGGDYRRGEWIAQGHHVARVADAFMPSGLLVFASSRFVVGSTEVDGYSDIDPPRLDTVYDDGASTSSPATAFGNLDARYRGRVVVGYLDGHGNAVEPLELMDRRVWSETAQRRGDPRWAP